MSFSQNVKRWLREAWHFVGTVDQLARPGDFLTLSLLGREIQIRNFDGNLRAYMNVCAHRHCLLTSQPAGNSPTMRCQYHGWEYGPDGRTRKIPCAKDLAPIDRDQLQLDEFTSGPSASSFFVCLVPNGPSLKEFLGPIFGLVQERFGAHWQRSYRGEFFYDANWKVAIENSLEAYHVESIHPETFRSAPENRGPEHCLNERHTSFTTDMPFAAHHRLDRWFHRFEARCVQWFGGALTGKYQQHHVFPNLLFSFTDAISLVHAVTPRSRPSRDRGVSIQYYRGRRSTIRRWIAKGLGRLEAVILRRIMNEDVSLYPQIQQGLASSPHRGTLARSEERIHAFQSFLAAALRPAPSQSIVGLNTT